MENKRTAQLRPRVAITRRISVSAFSKLCGSIGLLTFIVGLLLATFATANPQTPSGKRNPGARVYPVGVTPTPTATPCASIGSWTEQAPYPIAVFGNAVTSQGGNVYSFGGIVNNVAIANAYKYTPATNTWTSIASLPAPRGWFSATSDGTYVYLLGGVDQNFAATATLWRYDPVSNTYNTGLPSYTIPTYFHASAYLNGKIYRIAGRAIGTDFHVEVYDIATNAWSMAANYPVANHSLMAVALGSYVYGAGGNAFPEKTYRYDPNTDTWDDAAVADLPAGRSAAASGAYNGRWLLAGGDVNFAISSSAIAWDPATNTWSDLPNMVQTRDYLGGATAGQSFYAVAGNSSPATPTNDNQQYTETPCDTPTPTSTATPTTTPVACFLFENFDNVTPPTLPTGWTATNGINPDGILWQTSNSGLPSPPADSPPNAAWVNDSAAISDKYLDSPPIIIDQLENAALMFRNNYSLEAGRDGGVLEVSIDGGPFQDILAAGGFFQGGYNGTISACCGNPLAGRNAWTGSSGGFIQTAVGLPSGHTIVLRWRMGSDSGGSGEGWRVDSAMIICERPTPTSTPTITPPPTPTATLTPTSTPTAFPTPTPSEKGGTPTPTPTTPPCEYNTVTGTGSIIFGTTDIGNHCDNCSTLITLPFPVSLYMFPITQMLATSNGSLSVSGDHGYAGTSCPLPDPNLGLAILAYQDDLRTDGPNDGIFTLLTGTSPNRVFNIEWRTTYSGKNGTANFEVRFYENQNFFDVIYGVTADDGAAEESGVQPSAFFGTTFSCHTPTLTNGLKVTYTCGPPFTPTPTATPSATATATPTLTATPRVTPAPRLRPTPAPRP